MFKRMLSRSSQDGSKFAAENYVPTLEDSPQSLSEDLLFLQNIPRQQSFDSTDHANKLDVLDAEAGTEVAEDVTNGVHDSVEETRLGNKQLMVSSSVITEEIVSSLNLNKLRLHKDYVKAILRLRPYIGSLCRVPL